MVVNSRLVRTSANDIQPQTLIEGLPLYDQGAFDVTYNDYSQVDTSFEGEVAILKAFSDDVYAARLNGTKEPYRYGSYFIYEANNLTKQFRVASLVNLTSQDATALFPQFMYESILQQATGNPNLQFKVITAPFPVPGNAKEF